MQDLQAAIAEANESGVKISPTGNESEASRRTFAATIGLWTSRVNPALEHWVAAGKITKEEASRIKALSPTAQIPDVLKYFAIRFMCVPINVKALSNNYKFHEILWRFTARGLILYEYSLKNNLKDIQL